MKKWQLVLFLVGWLVLGIFVTAVNNLGAAAEHGEHGPTTAAVETAH
ncbi:hypothetical protein MHLNE_03260 [Moorella humiferrea]|uniref:Uncharacterized protein n=1 Tax=Neomoorella humiferrea TaxID=676965 RepID=A0A2T0AZ83_9FIRM|nr:hypothetical protein [Moorella humiferrea]PRR76182.1 hypothetical protein MOHU_00260 [Moorella humiferrea]